MLQANSGFFVGWGNIVPDQCGFGSVKRAERIFVVVHLVIVGPDRYVSDCHPAQRIADALNLCAQ